MKISRMVAGLMSLCFLTVQLFVVPAAQAAMVSTHELIQSDQRAAQEARIVETLQRSQVRDMLAENGLTLAQVEQRLQRLSNAEIAQLAERADQLPAGEGPLELVLVIFLVLILLDILGVTDVFPRI